MRTVCDFANEFVVCIIFILYQCSGPPAVQSSMPLEHQASRLAVPQSTSPTLVPLHSNLRLTIFSITPIHTLLHLFPNQVLPPLTRDSLSLPPASTLIHVILYVKYNL